MAPQDWTNYYISRARYLGTRVQIAVGVPVAEVIASFPPGTARTTILTNTPDSNELREEWIWGGFGRETGGETGRTGAWAHDERIQRVDTWD